VTVPTTAPNGVIRITEGPSYELTIVNPFSQSEPDSEDRIKTLRVYHAAHPGLTFTAIQDFELEYASPISQQFYEFSFAPTNAGVFVLTFLNNQDVPEEGPQSSVVPYVYGSPTLLWKQLFTDRCLDVTPTTVLREVIMASREIERYTNRFFYPKWIELRVNGSGSYVLALHHPIISLTQLHIRGEGGSFRSLNYGFGLVQPSLYVVDNRHIRYRKAFDPTSPTRPDGFLDAPGDGSGGIINPDDREAPQIRFRVHNETVLGRPNYRYRVFSYSRHELYRLRWIGFVRGNQNILLRGFFGYTEEDVSTPAPIRRVGEHMARREGIMRWGEPEEIEQERVRHKTIMEKTDTHLWMGEAKDRLAGPYTGDWEIDRVLVQYRRPAEIGVV
jgi:hypothetical protein